MSFPLLFSAVPLYAVDRAALQAGCPGGAAPEFRKTWFSDGGLSSNIPIHFFDGPIPRWPTFALNLRGFPQTKGGCAVPFNWSTAADAQKVFRATEWDPDVEVFEPTGSGRLFQFANSLIDAMQNWNDNTLMQLPGYRERTVEIAMSSDEGGLNLVMPAATLSSIMRRGMYAGAKFQSTFATPSLPASPAWNDHRQIRLRSALLMQSEWTRQFTLAWNGALTPPYATIIAANGASFSIPYTATQATSALAFAEQLAAAPGTIAPGVTLTDLPHPSPELRARPRV